MKIFFDGGCRPNPGAMETAVVARGQTHYRDDLGNGSNDQAEWLALLHAIDVAVAIGESDITLLGDSARIVRQANGIGKTPPLLQPYLAGFTERAKTFASLNVRRIGRAQNLAGIALQKRHPR